MAVLVQNNQKGPTVFQDYEWQGRDTNGDLQYVADETVESPDFLKAVRMGIFTIVEASPATEERLQAQIDAASIRKIQAQAEIQAGMDYTAEKPIATAHVQEDGREAGKVSIFHESEERDEDGKPVTQELRAFVDPLTRG